MTLRTLLPAIAAAITATGLALVPVAAAHAADDAVTWTVRTASNDFGADRTSYSYAITPGQSIDDALVVANHGDEPLDLAVYAADGYTTESGGFEILTSDETSVGVGAWLHTRTATITVAPGATVEAPFSIAVPANATPGDYAGGIVTTLTQPDAAQGINVDRRLGIRVGVRVGGDLTPSLSVSDVHVEWDGGLSPFAGGDATVTYSIRNTGNAVLSADQVTTVTGPFGWGAQHADDVAAPPQLLPGESWTVTATVSDVPAWFVLTATATVTPIVLDASGSTTPLAAVTATTTGAAVPWMLLAVVVLVAAAVFAGILLLRRGRARARAREDERVDAAVREALAGAGGEAQPAS